MVESRSHITKDKRQWDGRGKGTSAGNRFFMWVIRRCGVLPAYLFLVPACLSYAIADPNVRAAVLGLRKRLGLRTCFWHIYRHVYSFGVSLVDRFAFLLRGADAFSYYCEGEEVIKGLVEKGRGVVLVSGHVGNWEIAGSLLHDHLKVPINVVLLDAERESLRQIYADALAQRRFNVIPLSPGAPDTMVSLIAKLRAGEIVCLLADRVYEGRSITVPFLGSPAKFPLGPFAVAAVAGSPLVPVFVTKEGVMRYRFVAYNAVQAEHEKGLSRQAIIEQTVSAYVAAFEKEVREHPYQWFNFFDFWATCDGHNG